MSIQSTEKKKKITKKQIIIFVLGVLGITGSCFTFYRFGLMTGKKSMDTNKAFQTGLALGKTFGSQGVLDLIPGNAPEAWELLQEAIERNLSLRSGLTDLVLSYNYYRASEGV